MVEANRVRLIGLLAGLFDMLGTGDRVTRVVWRRVLAQLVPMESALRRLIYILARDLEITVPVARVGSRKGVKEKKREPGKPVFPLTDTLRDPDPTPRSCPTRKEPRILFLDEWKPRADAPKPADDDLMDVTALRRRLEALKAALADMPAQARRLARWRARNERMRKAGKWRRPYSTRSGRPPGHRKDGKREVDEVLANCDALALECRAIVEAERRLAG